MSEKKSTPISEYALKQGMRLKQIQDNLGYSSEKMAEILGVSTEQYRKYCTGESRLTSEKIDLLYEHVHIDVHYLVTGEKEKKVSFAYLISSMLPDEIKRHIDEVLDYIRTRVFDTIS